MASTPSPSASRVTEVLRNVEHQLLKLDLSIKVIDVSQLEKKKPLRTALEQSKEVPGLYLDLCLFLTLSL